MKKAGFTLTEMMVATSIFGMVMAGGLAVYVVCNTSWYNADIRMRSMREE